MFSRDNFVITDERLDGRTIRAWDLAATEPSATNPDPDWTVGARIVWNPDIKVGDRRGVMQIQHVARWRLGPGPTQDRFTSTCLADGLPRTVVEQEPGSAGKSLVESFARALAPRVRVEGVRPTGPKETRAELWASLAEQGRVQILAGDWTAEFLDEVSEFPNSSHDDQVDAVSLAASVLLGRRGPMRRPQQPRGVLPVGTGPRHTELKR
jgi:predicted phage terminase large subunit-like protein